MVKLMQITHVKPGKTGCPKSHCVLVDLATGVKKERLFRHAFGKARRTDDTCDVLHVQRTEYTPSTGAARAGCCTAAEESASPR